MEIMVVDDDPNFLKVFRNWMEKNGHEVIEARSGEECLEKINEEPDVIILDVGLPGIDGFEVCKRIKDDPKTKDIPIIILSVRGEEKDILEGLRLGATDYFPKTFSNKILLAKIDSITKTKKTEEQLRKKIDELERFTRLAVDRELKMIELKEKIKEMESELKRIKSKSDKD